MGPDTQSFANLEPVNPAAILKYSNNSRVSDTSLEKVFEDAGESSDPGGYYYVGLKFDAAGDTAGDLSFIIEYIVT